MYECNHDYQNCNLQFLEVDPDPCSMWNCEDSQLTDVAKIDILKNLNEARNLVANKKCSPECPLPCEYCNNSYEYCNMATLVRV